MAPPSRLLYPFCLVRLSVLPPIKALLQALLERLAVLFCALLRRPADLFRFHGPGLISVDSCETPASPPLFDAFWFLAARLNQSLVLMNLDC